MMTTKRSLVPLAVCLLALAGGCAGRGRAVAGALPEHPRSPAQQLLAPSGHGPIEHGRASYYHDGLAGNSTASGEPYDPHAPTAAHKELPLGAVVDVVRTDGRAVRVRINDRGPFVHGRIIDLSRGAAESIGMLREGVVEVALYLVWLPPHKQHAAARRKRR